MTESDDPIVSLFGGGGSSSSDVPVVEATPVKTTAAALPQLSEAAIQNRKRKASALTRDFAPPTLGKSGLLGMFERT